MRVWFLNIPLWLLGIGFAAFGLAALTMALVAEYVFGTLPCILCLWQRLPYFLIAVLGLVIFVRHKDPIEVIVSLSLIAMAFVFGGAIGLYQVGGEQGWWILSESCRGEVITQDMSVEDLLAQINAKQAVPCDVVTWSIFGLSFAAINAIISAIGFFKTLWFINIIRKEKA